MRPTLEPLESRDVPSGLHHHHREVYTPRYSLEQYGLPGDVAGGVVLDCASYNGEVVAAAVLMAGSYGFGDRGPVALGFIATPPTPAAQWTPAAAEAALARALPGLCTAPVIEEAIAAGGFAETIAYAYGPP